MKCLKTILINLAVLIVLLGALEVGFRFAQGGNKPPPPNSINLHLVPYYMFSNPPHSSYPQWRNEFTGELIPASVKANNRGFNDRHEFDYAKPYQKAPNE